MLPILLLVTTVVTIGPAGSPRLPEYPHVRSTDQRFLTLIEGAARRSVTFARLYARIQESDVILFVEPSRELRKSLSGRLVFLTATPLARYLRAEIRTDLREAELISTIAHEMQHALEIACAPNVRSQSAVAKLYGHNGRGPRRTVFESELAQEVARQVRRELLA